MKKQLTVFAAAAIFASFATAALAATPNITMSGSFKWNAEYNVTKQTWDGADNGLNYADTDPSINFSVATAGDPNLGTVGVNLWFDGANSDLQKDWKPTVTLAGGFYGGTLKLGQVAGNWDAVTAGTDGAGAEYVKTVNTLTVDGVATSATVAGRVGMKLSDTNSVFGGVAVDGANKGLMFAGGNFGFGTATVAGKFAAELGDTKNGTGLKGEATVKPIAPLTLTGTVIKADAALKDAKYIDTGDTAIVDHEFNKLYWAANHFPDGANMKVKAEYEAIKDVMKPWVEYKMYAKAAVDPTKTATWKLGAGTNFAPIFLTSASIAMDDFATEYVADFNKTVAGVGVEVKGALKTPKTGNSTTYGFVKGTKSFQWVSTWAFFGNDAHAEKFDPSLKVGASATFSF